MPVRELRWGILSTAKIGRDRVIPALQKAARCRVVAIGSRGAVRGGEVAKALGIPRVHDSYEALLADPEVDAIYNPLPNHMHKDWTIAAARAGKHVLCEKPLALSVADAQEMIDACADAGVRLMEAFMYRFHPSWIGVRDLIDSGRIGPVAAVQTWFGYYNDDPANIRNMSEAGGGALYDIGCYAINLSRMLMGGEPAGVAASVVRDPATRVDVLASAILDYGDRIASFTVSTRTETDQRVHVYGTTGRITIPIPFNLPADRPTQVLVTAGGDPPVAPATEVLTFPPADAYTAECEAFAAAVLDGTPVPLPSEDAVANLRVIEEIFRAAESATSATRRHALTEV